MCQKERQDAKADFIKKNKKEVTSVRKREREGERYLIMIL